MLRCVVVEGTCMLPIIRPGDMVLYEELDEYAPVEIGDVYVYRTQHGYFAHRARFRVFLPLVGWVTAFSGDRSLRLDFAARKKLLGIIRYCVRDGDALPVFRKPPERSVAKTVLLHIRDLCITLKKKLLSRRER